MIIINNCDDSRELLLVISGERLDLNEKFNLYLFYDEKTLKWKKDPATKPAITEEFCETVLEIAKHSPYNKKIEAMETRNMDLRSL
jgi:hypothetical protein